MKVYGQITITGTEDGIAVYLTNTSYQFLSDSNNNISNEITTTTIVKARQAETELVPIIGTLPSVLGLNLTKSGSLITITATVGTDLDKQGSFDIPVTVNDKDFVLTFSYTKILDNSSLKSDIENINKKIASSESAITNVQNKINEQQGLIEQRVEKDVFDESIRGITNDLEKANQGINKWKIELYNTDTDSSVVAKRGEAIPEENRGLYDISAIWGDDITPYNTLLLLNSDLSESLGYGNNYIGYAYTFIYCTDTIDQTMSFKACEKGTLYVNAKETINSIAVSTDFTLHLKRGWNSLEVVWNVGTSDSQGFLFNSSILSFSQVYLMNCNFASITARNIFLSKKVSKLILDTDSIQANVEKNIEAISNAEKKISTAESDISNLNIKAGKIETDLSKFKTSVSDTYETILNVETKIQESAASVKTDIAANYTTKSIGDKIGQGLDKWILEQYQYTSSTLPSSVDPLLITGKTPDSIIEVLDSSLQINNNVLSSNNYCINHLQTYVYFSTTKTISITLTFTSKIIVCLNGANIYEPATTGTKTINITFSGGWNVLEIWMRRSSSEYCYMDKTISTIPECSIMNCYSSFSSNLKEEKTAALFYREIFNDDGSSRIEQTATQLGWFLETGSTETSIILKDNLIQAITDKYVVKGSDGEVIIQNGSIKAGSITTEMLKFGMGQNIYSTGYDTFENTVYLTYSTMSNTRIGIEPFSYTDSYGSTAYFGSKCLAVYGTISSSSDYFILGSEDNYYGTICLNPEKKYIISWYERRMENYISINNYSANLIVRKSKARDISNIIDTTYSFACNNSWTRHEINYTPDSEYPYISLGFGNLPSINFYIDAIQIEEVDDFSKGASSFSPAINYVINVESLSTNGLASISEKLGTIMSGILKSAGYSYSSGNYTSSGYIIDLDNNIIRTPKLYASNSVLAISPTTGSLASYTLSSTYMYRGSSSIGASGNSYSYIGISGFSLSNKLVYKTSDGSIAFKGGTIATTNIDQDVYFRNKINLYYSTSLTSSTPTSKYGEALSVPSTGTSLVIASGFSDGAEVKNALKVTGNLTVTGDIVDIDSIVSSSGNKAFNYFNANLYKFKNGLKYCFINCASLGAISAGNAVTCTNAIPDDYVPKAPYLNTFVTRTGKKYILEVQTTGNFKLTAIDAITTNDYITCGFVYM